MYDVNYYVQDHKNWILSLIILLGLATLFSMVYYTPIEHRYTASIIRKKEQFQVVFYLPKEQLSFFEEHPNLYVLKKETPYQMVAIGEEQLYLGKKGYFVEVSFEIPKTLQVDQNIVQLSFQGKTMSLMQKIIQTIKKE